MKTPTEQQPQECVYCVDNHCQHPYYNDCDCASWSWCDHFTPKPRKMDNKQTPTEDERIAYELGYRHCCQDNGIPYVGIRKPLADKSILAFHIEITDKEAEYIFPDRTDELAKYITRKLEEGYEKFKRGESLD